MTQVWSLIGVVAAIHGILLGAVFYFHQKLDWKKRLYFSLILIPFSFCLAEYSAYWSNYIIRYPHLAFTTVSLPFLFSPFLYFLAREFTSTELKFKLKDLLHFVPAIIHFFLNSGFYLKSSVEKEAILRLLIYSHNPEFSFTFYLMKTTLFIQAAFYIVAIWRMSKHLISLEKQYLRVLAFGIGLFITQSFVQAINIYLSGYEFIFQLGATLVLSSSFMLYLITYLSIFNPLFLAKANNRDRYKGNKLGESAINSINSVVMNHLQTSEKYQSKKLSLNEIAKEVQIPPHHISQAVNLGLKMSITDLINKYRIDDVKVKLVSPEFGHYSILAIGLDAGFSTKASFYNAFKRHTGMTPTEFVKASKINQDA